MKNTLKYALIGVGLILIGYGLYSVFFQPEFMVTENGEMTSSTEKAQSLAMIGLGVLSLLSGLAFRKR